MRAPPATRCDRHQAPAEPPCILDDFLSAEIAEKQARSIKCQMTGI
jgi:hypothetical protein